MKVQGKGMFPCRGAKNLVFNHLCRQPYQGHGMSMEVALITSDVQNAHDFTVRIEDRGGGAG